jgi:hypothetical protein
MKERKDSPESLPATGSLASLLHPAVPEMKSFCGGTKMDDLQGPEVEAILLHFACHHHTLYECAVEESLVECSKCRRVLSVSYSSQIPKLFSVKIVRIYEIKSTYHYHPSSRFDIKS